MLKKFLNNSSPTALFLLDANNDKGAPEKTPAELARENIKVENANPPETEKEEGEENENEKEEEQEEQEEEEGDEDDDKKDEETDEEKEARLKKEQENKAAKEQRTKDRQQRRIDKVTAEAKAAQARVKELEAQLVAKPKEGLTEEDIKAEAKRIAKAERDAEELEKIQTEFQKTCNKLNKDAIKLDKDFDDKISELAEDIGPIPSAMIGILDDLDNENGADVLVYLANEPEEAEKIWNLSVARMASKLVKISDTIKENKKKAAEKPRSKVPPPNAPIREAGDTNSIVITGKESMDEYVRKRNAQDEQRRKARGY